MSALFTVLLNFDFTIYDLFLKARSFHDNSIIPSPVESQQLNKFDLAKVKI
jgi:hypothetical protein